MLLLNRWCCLLADDIDVALIEVLGNDAGVLRSLSLLP